MDKKIIKRAERVLKGAGNYSRIRILDFIARQDNTSLWIMSESLDIDFRLVSHHAAVLEKAGLIEKFHVGASVHHSLTPYGQKVCEFVSSLS